MRGYSSSVIVTFLILFGCTNTLPSSRKDSVPEMRASKQIPSQPNSETNLGGHNVPLHYVKSENFIKTTSENCEIRGGQYIFGHKGVLPQDMIDCSLLPSIIRRLMKHMNFLIGLPILGSVYDYLYRTSIEKPGYGLYSYILIPTHQSRDQKFLSELFKTTSFVELSGITTGNLNIIYLPTLGGKLSTLIPKINDGSPPPVNEFAMQYYDYALAQKILASICNSHSEKIRDVCSTDLSRGPYLFTLARPASALTSMPPPYLFVDLSNVHERAFGEFIAAYKEQVKRSDFSDLKRIDTLRLHILSIVLTAADWVGPIKGAVAETVHLVKEDKVYK